MIDWDKDMICAYCGSLFKAGMEYVHPDGECQEAFEDTLSEQPETNLGACSESCWKEYMAMVYASRPEM